MPTTTPPVRVLHLEDSLRDAEIVRDVLEHDSAAFDIVHVDNRERFESALATASSLGAPDVIICDFNLPGVDGLTALRLAKERFPETPVIIVSGTIDAGEAVECLREGATDYLLKQRLERLPSAVKRALDEAEQRRQRQETNAKLRESEERFRQLAEQSSEGFWFIALNPERVQYVSPGVERIWGLSAERLCQDPQLWMTAIHADDRARIQEAWETSTMGQVQRFEEEYRVVRPDGSVRWVMDSFTLIQNEAGAITGLSGLSRDITDRRELEAQFRQAQKIESVGQLAGGIAHDFNNLLTVINGMADLALEDLGDGDRLRADLNEIRNAGERAAALTRQLLTFSRKQILQPRVLNLATVVAGMQSLLRRLIREDIAVVLRLAERPGHVRVDPGQIEQVVVNLVINARDAMPNGGTLTIETRDVELDEAYAGTHVGVQPGRYVMLAVSDTGVGMDEVTRGRIFEPFFTTKEVGKGTGLGLATVHGIVVQSGGAIWVHSEVGRGTTFKIYLPQVAEAADVESPNPTVARTSGTETVLLVEDSAALRAMAVRILGSAGYTVLAASNGKEALLALERSEAPVHILLTDVVMPGMDGRELAQRCRHVHPGIKILYTSGYSDDALGHHGVLGEGIRFIGKPFTAAELTRKVRDALDSEG